MSDQSTLASTASWPSSSWTRCNPQEVIKAVRAATRVKYGNIPLHKPEITLLERDYAARCIREDLVGYRWVDRFEKTLAEICCVKHAVAMSSGTAALEAALRCVVGDKGGRIVMPSLTFHATAAAAMHMARCSPRFIDADFVLNAVDVDQHLRKDATNTAAVVAVDLLGHRPDMEPIEIACFTHGPMLIEDAAEAIGQINGIHCAAAIVSFNGNKTMTTNGGGALLTDSDSIADEARELCTTGRRKHPWLVEPSSLGWNWRMGNINAAIGCAQLERLPEMKRAKHELALRYQATFSEVDGARFIEYPWLNVIMVPAEDRDVILEAMVLDGIAARALFTPLHMTEPYAKEHGHGHFPRSVETWRRTICLPSGPGLA